MNDPIQYQMLPDALNFSSNSIVGLSGEFINNCKAETVVNTLVSKELVTTVQIFQYKSPQTFYGIFLLQPSPHT
jgi:hypothetical protein